MLVKALFQAVNLLLLIELSQSYLVTSVWCHGSHQDHRHCAFQNLCYSPYAEQYLFFHSHNESIMSGIDDPNEQIDLVRLSSVIGNKELYLNYVSMPALASQDYDTEFVDLPVLLVKRWRPFDAFSMIHDDLLPIYLTLQYLCHNEVQQCIQDFVIAFEDNHKVELYEKLFPNVMYLRNYKSTFSENQLLCFKKLTVGLESESVWYNHGFDTISGPVQNLNFRPFILEDFRKFVLSQLKIVKCDQDGFVVVILEDSTRFENSAEVIEALQQQKQKWPSSKLASQELKILNLNMLSTSMPELIAQVSCARILLAFHTPYLIAAIFLPKLHSGVLELFPYGLDEATLPQFATLATLRGLKYRSWINADKALSTYNGKLLSKLKASTLESILEMDYVPPGLCCYDPALMIKLGQVTTVDTAELLQTFQELWKDALNLESDNNEVIDDPSWIIPAPVQAARCQLDDASNILEISWKPPLNLNFIKHERVVYEVIAYGVPLEDLASLDYLSEFSTSDTKIQLPLKNILKHWKIQINIVALLDQGLNSAETIIACDL